MPLISIPKIPYLPGVPAAIPRLPTSIAPVLTTALGAVQGLLWRAFQVDDRWGVWVTKDGKTYPFGQNPKYTETRRLVIDTLGVSTSTSSTFSTEYSKESGIMDTPIEEGSFASYNRAEMPATPMVTMNVDGDEEERRKLLDAIENAIKTTDLFSIVTPEKTYIDYAIERYNYTRKASTGLGKLQIEVGLKEVRQVTAKYTENDATTANAQSADAKPPTPTVEAIPEQPPSVLRQVWDRIRSILPSW